MAAYLRTLLSETEVSDRRTGRWILAFAGSANMAGNCGKGTVFRRYKEEDS